MTEKARFYDCGCFRDSSTLDLCSTARQLEQRWSQSRERRMEFEDRTSAWWCAEMLIWWHLDSDEYLNHVLFSQHYETQKKKEEYFDVPEHDLRCPEYPEQITRERQ